MATDLPTSDTAAGLVLVISPDGDVSRMLSVLLRRDGHRVALAETANAGVTLAAPDPPDVVLIDEAAAERAGSSRAVPAPDPSGAFGATLRPQGSGFSVLEEISRLENGTETILLTRDPSPDAVIDAIDRGFYDVLLEPFANLRLVSQKVRRAVQSAHATRQRERLLRALHDRSAAVDALRAELDRKRQEIESAEAARVAGVDPLTGLSSQDAVEQRLRIETARALRYSRPLAIARARIDALEYLARHHGREAADVAVRAIAARTRAAIREVDIIGRHGADGFLYIFPETTKDDAARVAERLRRAVEEAVIPARDSEGEIEISLTVSFAVAALPGDGMNADGLLRRADGALTRARSEGANRIYV